MKIQILQLLLATALATTANSQTSISTVTNATKPNVNIVSTNPDEGKHASIYAGTFGPEGENVIGASYYKPTLLYLNVLAGPTGGMIDGSFFFTSKMKASKLKQSAKLGTTRYVISAPMEQRKSIGIHTGASYVDYSVFAVSGSNNYSSSGVFGGVTFLSSRHAHWKVDNDKKEVQGTTLGRLNADVIYYTNRKLDAITDGKERLGIDDVSRKIGFRIYFDGKTSTWSGNGRTAIHYMIGIGRNSDKSRAFAPFVGLGFGYNFL